MLAKSNYDFLSRFERYSTKSIELDSLEIRTAEALMEEGLLSYHTTSYKVLPYTLNNETVCSCDIWVAITPKGIDMLEAFREKQELRAIDRHQRIVTNVLSIIGAISGVSSLLALILNTLQK